MYIKRISIQNYRNFNNFSMEFHEGLNVIVGANNSGKTGLLSAIRLISKPTITVHDFNKNNMKDYKNLYKDLPPKITIIYEIEHSIDETVTEDESIIKLISFLGLSEIERNQNASLNSNQYNVSAQVKMEYTLNSKKIDEYKSLVSEVKDINSFEGLLHDLLDHYTWRYTNGVSETEIEKKEATSIFDIKFIAAERTSDEVNKEMRRELDNFSKLDSNYSSIRAFEQRIIAEMESLFGTTLSKVTNIFTNEKNEIGLEKGNVKIKHRLSTNVSLSESYSTSVQDSKSDAILPLEYNGLGYNNLINVYLLIKLNDISVGKDFRILCLEEPEAHLHPAMQYKLFKYLSNLNSEGKLNQQLFVTTHSSNISAVAGLDNMFMMAYDRENGNSECRQQSMQTHFLDKTDAKTHLSKFLDVTRSDMLFADKVILVEGIAEKLLLPKFMEKCDCSYEDEHVAIVEIGGKHFNHFLELFNGNAVKKKVLIITDKDFDWFDEDKKNLNKKSDYESFRTDHVDLLNKNFPIENKCIETQTLAGKTFEDELIFSNMDKENVVKSLLKLVCPESLHKFIEENGVSYQKWNQNESQISKALKIIPKFLSMFNTRINEDKDNETFYEKLFFAEVFLYYAKSNKGTVALNILSDESIMNEIIVPPYIDKGLKWLCNTNQNDESNKMEVVK